MEDQPNSEAAKKTLSPSERITELNDIDKSITQLLKSASKATAVLSNSSTTNTTTLETAQEAFQAASSDYFSTLSSIEVCLRRQVYALEEAGLISSGTERDTRRGRTLTVNPDGSESGLSNKRSAGGGALDPSWLNARVSDSVDMRKKMDLLAQGKKLVEDLQKKQSTTRVEDDKMDQGDG